MLLITETYYACSNSQPDLHSMIRLLTGQHQVLIDNDPTYSFGCRDNPRIYQYAYRLDEGSHSPSSLHSIRVVSTEDECEVSSCILGASRGASSIHDHSAVICDNSLIVAVGPFVAALHLPTLELRWKTRADEITCFGVYHSPSNDCFISHGELEVARISYQGKIEWSNGGADIFTNGFALKKHCVEVVDWNDDVYLWDIRTGESVTTITDETQNPSN